MTSDAQPAARRGSLSPTLIGLAVLLAAGVAAGAWFDWAYWHPSNALALYVTIPLLCAIGVVLVLVRRLPALMRYGAFAIALGLLAGSALGPSRPAPIQHEASVILRLTSPFVAEATGTGGCQTVAAGDQLDVYGDMDLRVGEGTDEVVIGFDLSSGDMWADARGRSDGLDLLILWAPAVIIDEASYPGETRMISDTGSTLEADVEGLEGSVSFDGLVVAPPSSGSSQVPVDVAGTIEWTCEG